MANLRHIVKSRQFSKTLSTDLTAPIRFPDRPRRARAGYLANSGRIDQSDASQAKGGRPVSLGDEAIAVEASIPAIPAKMENSGILLEPNLTQSVGRLPPDGLLRGSADRKYAFLTPDVQDFRGNRRACGRNYGGGRQ